MKHVLLVSSLIIGFVSATVFADVYQWVDDDGVTQYSGTKPQGMPGVSAVTLKNTKPLAPRESLQARIDAFDERQENQNKAAEEAAKANQALADEKRRCDQARARVASLARPRVNKINEDGTRSRMSEEWRQQQLSEANAAIAKLCQ